MPTDDYSFMDHAFDRIAQLLHRQLTGEALSAAELQELEAWGRQSAGNAALLEKIHHEASIHDMLQTWHRIERNREQNRARFLAQLQAPAGQAPRLSFFRGKVFRYAAAAALIIGIATITWQHTRTPAPPAISLRESAPIAPGREGAILTLADGSQMVLDSAGNGVIAHQNGARVVLQNGQLAYNSTGGGAGAVAYNTVSTPKGRQFKLILPDGTKVWLNAASAIKYPTAFSGTTRAITVEGEAYFEVAANDKAPFTVTAGGATIEVLGTSFNVNAYTNENSIRTTLLSGAVRVSAYQHSATLKPAQQATVKPSGAGLTVTSQVDTDQVMAWKNGLFNFENASLDEVMRQLERWYDIEVVYQKGIPPTRFGGEINKQNTLQDVLQILEGSNVHFQLQGRKLIVMP